MKEIPILFSTEMVQAIIAGQKTQTRRIMKPQPVQENAHKFTWAGTRPRAKVASGAYACSGENITPANDEFFPFACAPWKPGDVLWVRESFTLFAGQPIYKANYHESIREQERWKPSIHMPKAACRIKLQVVSVRAERLNDISESDAIAEGIQRNPHAKSSELMAYKNYITGNYTVFPYASFRTLWESINGYGSWDQNPWVWVIEFKKL